MTVLLRLAALLTGWPVRNGVGRERSPAGAWVNGVGGEHLGSIVVMVPEDAGVGGTPAAAAPLDPESAEWLRVLADTGRAAGGSAGTAA